MTDETKVCLDLFCGLGGFSAAFEDADDWGVVTVDLEAEFGPDLQADVLDLRPADLLDAIGLDREDIDVLVVLASPPCQYLSTAGNHDKWDMGRQVPTAPESRGAVALFYHALGLIQSLGPDYWYVENPRRSRIRWFVGPPDEWVAYCQYGTDYQKQTGLWGRFAPMTFERCSSPGPCHVRNVEDDGREAVDSMSGDHAERAKVPYDLSATILEAVEAALAGDALEQATIPEVTSP